MNCKKCGAPLDSSWKICPNCGTPTGVQKSARHKKKAVYKNGWFWVVILLLIIVLGLAAYIGILSQKGAKDENKTEPKKEEKEAADFSSIDMEMLFGQPEDYAAEIGLENSEENPAYTGLDGSVQAVYQEGNLINIVIQGSGEEMPSFHGVRTGMAKEEAVEKMKDAYPEIVDSGESIQFMNLDAKRNVVCGLNENNVASINISILSDEEIGNYRQAKEEQLREQYIFPDSNSRYLSEEEVRGVEADRLFIGRNEIFARHGYIFQDEGLQQHFNSMPWYSGTVTAEQFNADAVFNDFEKKNAELIKRIEDEVAGTNNVSGQFIGSTGVYICITPGSFTGKIEILSIGDSSIQYSLGALEMPQAIVTEEALITGNNTAQANLYGYEITFTWSDAENMYVTSSGELTGMDSGTIMEITTGMGYRWSTEFNRWQ